MKKTTNNSNKILKTLIQSTFISIGIVFFASTFSSFILWEWEFFFDPIVYRLAIGIIPGTFCVLWFFNNYLK